MSKAIQPRLLSISDAAAYCGVSVATFKAWVSAGLMPQPVFDSRRWDLKAIDLILDRESGIPTEAPAQEEDAFQRWERENGIEPLGNTTSSNTAWRKFHWRDQTPPTTPLGKREVRALKAIAAASESGRRLHVHEIPGSSEVTLWKMTIRGLLHEQTVADPHLRLTKAGRDALEKELEKERQRSGSRG